MNSGIPEAPSNNNNVIKAARLSEPSACVRVWVPGGPCPALKGEPGPHEWRGKCQSLEKKFAAKKETSANILQPGRIVNVPVYLAGIGSRA